MSADTIAYWSAKNARWVERPTGYANVRAYVYEPPASNLRLSARAVNLWFRPRWYCTARIRDGRNERSVTVRNATSRFRGTYAAIRALQTMLGSKVRP